MRGKAGHCVLWPLPQAGKAQGPLCLTVEETEREGVASCHLALNWPRLDLNLAWGIVSLFNIFAFVSVLQCWGLSPGPGAGRASVLPLSHGPTSC